jgi:hypothetical protein
MRVAPQICISGLLCLLASVQPIRAMAEVWLPVTPDELHLTSIAQAPGAAAVILYRQVDRNDSSNYEDVYLRVKILTDEGRKYADIQIPYLDYYQSVRGLEARTIRPDGSIVPFNGTVYEKKIVSFRAGALLAKTFQLPAVETGCIVEYRYRHHFAYGWAYNSRWILSDDLFTRTAKFSLVPNPLLSLRWSWTNGLPPGTPEPRMEKGRVVLEAHDVAAFVTEDRMPPEDELKSRVDFIYTWGPLETDPAVFWRKFGIEAYKGIQTFADKRAAMERAVAQIIAPGDSDEQKLRKIYARMQRLRNLSYERSKTEQESEREGAQKIHSVKDVWDHGGGGEEDINWLFLALARATGLQADAVLVAQRSQHVFSRSITNSGQLDASAVLVNVGGKDVYLDPGVPYNPFGLQPWDRTDAHALRLNANGGTWVITPLPDASTSRIERHAVLKLAAGTLEGKLIVRYTGLEASGRRLSQRAEDDTGRRQFLERQIEEMVPVGIDVKLSNSPDWGESDATLVAEYELRVPGWTTGAGRRELLPVGLFGGAERHTFEHATRLHPMYFEYPREYLDDVTIELPAGWHVDSVPQARAADLKVLRYKSSAQHAQQSVHLMRELTLNLYEAAAKSYAPVQGFFQTVRTGDEEQVVIVRDVNAAR